jgi:CheY-like chemotaxis protein
MGGEDLIRALRAERPGLPVVVVTGSAPFGGQEELRRHAGGHGPLLVLLKPPDYAELAAALRRAVAAAAAPAPANRCPAPEAVPSMELAG